VKLHNSIQILMGCHFCGPKLMRQVSRNVSCSLIGCSFICSDRARDL